MNCPKCGKKVSSDLAFCFRCNIAINEDGEVDESRYPPSDPLAGIAGSIPFKEESGAVDSDSLEEGYIDHSEEESTSDGRVKRRVPLYSYSDSDSTSTDEESAKQSVPNETLPIFLKREKEERKKKIITLVILLFIGTVSVAVIIWAFFPQLFNYIGDAGKRKEIALLTKLGNEALTFSAGNDGFFWENNEGKFPDYDFANVNLQTSMQSFELRYFSDDDNDDCSDQATAYVIICIPKVWKKCKYAAYIDETRTIWVAKLNSKEELNSIASLELYAEDCRVEKLSRCDCKGVFFLRQ